MKYLLDTNICIYFLKAKYNLIDKIEKVGLNNCAVSEITLAEMVFGAENSQNPTKNLQLLKNFSEQVTILPIFDAIHLYGKEKARLRKAGKIISDFDLLIGATAITNGLIMVTRNTKEFERLEGINIEDWTK